MSPMLDELENCITNLGQQVMNDVNLPDETLMKLLLLYLIKDKDCPTLKICS